MGFFQKICVPQEIYTHHYFRSVCELYEVVLIVILTNLSFAACCEKTSHDLTTEKRELLPSPPLLNLSSPCGFIPLLCLLAPTNCSGLGLCMSTNVFFTHLFALKEKRRTFSPLRNDYNLCLAHSEAQECVDVLESQAQSSAPSSSSREADCGFHQTGISTKSVVGRDITAFPKIIRLFSLEIGSCGICRLWTFHRGSTLTW